MEALVTQRQCRRGHLVDDETARFCPLCGAMLDVPSPEALAAGDRLKRQAQARRRAGRAILVLVALLALSGYLLRHGERLQQHVFAWAQPSSPSPSPTTITVMAAAPAARVSPTPSVMLTYPTITPSWPMVDVSGCTLDMAFVRDESLPDGTRLDGGTDVVKEWQVRNSGTCPWGPGYELVRASDDDLALEERVPLESGPAGETTVVSVRLRVPLSAGTYRSDWRLCVNGDICFGPTLYAQVISLGPPSTRAP